MSPTLLSAICNVKFAKAAANFDRSFRKEMIGYRLTFSILAAFIIYLALNFVYGPAGLDNLERRARYADRLTENLEKLSERSAILEREVTILRSQPEAIRVLARDQGFFDDADGLVYVEGYRSVRTPMSPGGVVFSPPARADRRSTLRLVASLAGLVIFFVSSLASDDRAAARTAHRNRRSA
jgi:cell division protein FtsB